MTSYSALRYLTARNPDGTGNAPGDAGAAGTQFIRLAEPDYADGYGEMVDRGNSRHISNAVVAQGDHDIPNTHDISSLYVFFGQFIDHDFDLTAEGHTETSTISAPDVPGGSLSFTRSAFEGGTGYDDPRQHVNKLTSFVDGSNVYGSSAEDLALLREGDGYSAYLKTSTDGMLPTLKQIKDEHGGNPDTSGIGGGPGLPDHLATGAGDSRSSENIALTSIHTIWVREHNYQVDRIRDSHHDWSEQEIFEAARVVVEAEIQHVVYDEWLPLLIGKALPHYHGHTSDDPSVSHEFATAAFRLGHSLLPTDLERQTEDGSDAGSLDLASAFFNPGAMGGSEGMDNLLRGLMGDTASELDTKIVDDVRNLLFNVPGAPKRDLAVLNIERGRDHGLASLNDTREALGLERHHSIDDLTSDDELREKLKEAYGYDDEAVDRIDLWVGGLAEDDVYGSQVGETFQAILIDQFARSRDGDQYFYENRLAHDPDLLHEIKDTKFSDIIARATGIEHIQDDVFIAHNRIAGTDDSEGIYGTDTHDLMIGFAGNDHIYGEDGDDDLFGDDGHDALYAGNGDDIAYGGYGNDLLLGWWGDDILHGEEGNDVAYGGYGNDEIYGGLGNDVLHGEYGNDHIDGGHGSDHIYGGAHADTVFAGSGNDRVHGGSGSDDLYGEHGADRISGEHGIDYIVGGQGRDILSGGAQRDYFAYQSRADLGTGRGSADKILDFRHKVDKIDLSDVDASTKKGGNQAFKFIGSSEFHDRAGELRVEHVDRKGYANDRTYVEGDLDGNGHADFSIELVGLHQITSGDFYI